MLWMDHPSKDPDTPNMTHIHSLSHLGNGINGDERKRVAAITFVERAFVTPHFFAAQHKVLSAFAD
jgi:hypothetical protein